jgi:hypothetical protein
MAGNKGKQKLPYAKNLGAPATDAGTQSGAGWADISHFKPRDFTCRCEGLCGHPDLISRDLVAKLDKIQDLIGMPVSVLSGTRCKKFNLKCGGREHSAHTARDGVSHAADIKCPDAAYRFAFLAAALPLFNRIGVAKDHVHVDDDPDLSPNAVWLC